MVQVIGWWYNDSDRLDRVIGWCDHDSGNDYGSYIWSTFIFQGGRMEEGKGIVSSFQLVSDNIGIWSFL
jgi:hypothetical protein